MKKPPIPRPFFQIARNKHPGFLSYPGKQRPEGVYVKYEITFKFTKNLLNIQFRSVKKKKARWKRRERSLISLENIPRIHLVRNVIQDCVVAVGDDGVRL